MGEVALERDAGTYMFRPGIRWNLERILPPSLYSLREAEREMKRATEYRELSGGLWAMAVDHFATVLLSDSQWPDCVPQSFAGEIPDGDHA
jgi:hypothetical protein